MGVAKDVGIGVSVDGMDGDELGAGKVAEGSKVPASSCRQPTEINAVNKNKPGMMRMPLTGEDYSYVPPEGASVGNDSGESVFLCRRGV